MKIHELLNEAAKACWPGHRKVGTQPGTGKNAGKPVNKCKKIGEDAEVDESGLQYHTGVKKHGKPYMTAAAKLMRDGGNQKELGALKDRLSKAHKGKAKKEGVAEGVDELARVLELSGLDLSPDEQFDIIEDMVESVALAHGVDAETIWEEFESVDDHELFEAAAWQKKSGKSKSGGLNAKGVASYRRENPGSKLQMAVTTKPSKLKPGSKAAKRRKSFCARMGGNKGPMKKPNGKPTRKALALRKWNC